jgi:hypothetical protein
MPRQPGAVFLINKITNPSSGNSRYPEILFRHPFNESGISDSEIFALYAAAERFFERKNIHFFICPADTENIKHVSEIKKWAQIRAQFEPDASHFRQNAAELTQSERDTAEKVITQLKLTQTQRHDFLRCLVNCKLRGGFPEAEISEFAFANPAGKKERSAVYDKLKQKLNFIDY